MHKHLTLKPSFKGQSKWLISENITLAQHLVLQFFKLIRTCLFSILGLLYILDAILTEWTSFTDCSVTCGRGTKTRKRKIVANATNDEASAPILQETKDCTLEDCITEGKQYKCVLMLV